MPDQSSKPLRVLVVDDNLDAAMGLSLLMRALGHHSRMVHDGETAVAAAVEYQPHLVFLDIGLPGMDGWEVSMRIRQVPALRTATLVAVTGWGTYEAMQRSTAAGINHHLVKPADTSRLKEIVAAVGAAA